MRDGGLGRSARKMSKAFIVSPAPVLRSLVAQRLTVLTAIATASFSSVNAAVIAVLPLCGLRLDGRRLEPKVAIDNSVNNTDIINQSQYCSALVIQSTSELADCKTLGLASKEQGDSVALITGRVKLYR